MKYLLSKVFFENIVNNEENSVNNEENSVNMDAELEKKLWDISEIAREKKRIDPAEMKKLILNLCDIRPLTLKELAELLGRTEDGIRNNYLGQLKDEDKIRLRYPGQINHPKQAYITVKADD